MGEATSKATTYNIKKAHELLGHNNKNDTRQMASHLGWTITRGCPGVCESCANIKGRQNNVPKISTGEKATVINNWWFHDSFTLKVHKGEKGSSKIWDLTVDELTGIPFTGIYNKKNEFVESMCQRIQAQTARGCLFLIMRQDNAGENKTWGKRLQSADWKLQGIFLSTVCLTSIYYQVPGYDFFCFAPSKTIVGQINIIRSPNWGIVW